MLETVNPQKYFKETWLSESLVLEFTFARAPEQVNLVFVYELDSMSSIEKPLGPSASLADATYPVRGFRRLVFDQVGNLIVQKAIQRGEQIVRADYALDPAAGSQVIQFAEVTRVGNRYELSLHLDRTHHFLFRFSALRADRRLLHAIRRGPVDWTYVDPETEEEVDFYHPFGSAVERT